MAKYSYFSFSVKILKFTFLWSDENGFRIIKDWILIISLMPCALPILADFCYQLYVGVYNLTALTENLIALNCIIGMIYMTICFLRKRHLIKQLVEDLATFQEFCPMHEIHETDKLANLYAKLFMFYGIIGNIVYITMPHFTVEQCEDIRQFESRDSDIPCGLVTRGRLPFKFDYSPLFEAVFIHQFYTCTMVTVIILDLTMLLCSFLLHIINQLKRLKTLIPLLDLSRNLKSDLRFFIRYHIAIIRYSEQTNEAFGTMMMLHLTLTSLVISALGFEIIIVHNFSDSLRFTLHLVGWLVLLLLICYYGQVLIDESAEVDLIIYFLQWHNLPVKIRTDLHMIQVRSQKPLTLSAASVGNMSFPTFLRVISSAYSYFTLLLNIKS